MNLEDELARKEKFLQLFCVDQLLGYMEGQEYQKEKRLQHDLLAGR